MPAVWLLAVQPQREEFLAQAPLICPGHGEHAGAVFLLRGTDFHDLLHHLSLQVMDLDQPGAYGIQQL
jgi:hypothetical protein